MIQNDLPSLTGMLPEMPGEHAPQHGHHQIQVPVFESPKPAAAGSRAAASAPARPTRKAARSYKEEPEEVPRSMYTQPVAHVCAGGGARHTASTIDDDAAI